MEYAKVNADVKVTLDFDRCEMGSDLNDMNAATPISPNAKDEMEFRLSLLKLMTVPHEGSASVAPTAASRQIEELSVLVPRARKADQRA